MTQNYVHAIARLHINFDILTYLTKRRHLSKRVTKIKGKTAKRCDYDNFMPANSARSFGINSKTHVNHLVREIYRLSKKILSSLRSFFSFPFILNFNFKINAFIV